MAHMMAAGVKDVKGGISQVGQLPSITANRDSFVARFPSITIHPSLAHGRAGITKLVWRSGKGNPSIVTTSMHGGMREDKLEDARQLKEALLKLGVAEDDIQVMDEAQKYGQKNVHKVTLQVDRKSFETHVPGITIYPPLEPDVQSVLKAQWTRRGRDASASIAGPHKTAAGEVLLQTLMALGLGSVTLGSFTHDDRPVWITLPAADLLQAFPSIKLQDMDDPKVRVGPVGAMRWQRVEGSPRVFVEYKDKELALAVRAKLKEGGLAEDAVTLQAPHKAHDWRVLVNEQVLRARFPDIDPIDPPGRAAGKDRWR